MQTTPLFTRHGQHQVPNQLDDKGNPLWVRPRACGRCGGAGRSDRWRFTGLICYDCGGSGQNGEKAEKLYSAEKLQKLNAVQNKRAAKRMAIAEQKRVASEAEASARREVFEHDNAEILSWLRSKEDAFDFLVDMARLANTKAHLSEAQLAALHKIKASEEARAIKKAASEYVGEIGKRIECPVTVERVTTFERKSFGGYGEEMVYVVTMRDETGNSIVSMSPRFSPKQDEKITIRATVKDHSQYNGERQTKVERVAVI